MSLKKGLDQLIEEFLEHLEVEKNCSPLTIRNYHHYLGRFSSWLGKNYPGTGISGLSLEKIRKFRVYLARFIGQNGKNLSSVTQAYHVIALRSFLKWLNKNDYKTLSPEKIDLPKSKTKSLKFLSGGQVERLLGQPSVSTIRGLRDKAILEIVFSTGLRVSEVVRLNRDQVDLKRRVFKSYKDRQGQAAGRSIPGMERAREVRMKPAPKFRGRVPFGVIGKGGRPRVVFLSPRAAKWLERYLEERNDRFLPLFVAHPKTKNKIESVDNRTDDEARLTARSIQRIVRKHGRKAKLPMEVTPHVLRHSFATDLLMAGADLRSVQEMLGHKNIATTQVYTHVTNRQLREVHQAFHGKGGK